MMTHFSDVPITRALTPGACGFETGRLPADVDALATPADLRTRDVVEYERSPNGAGPPPYPGPRPASSFVMRDGEVLGLRPSPTGCGWSVPFPGGSDLDLDLDTWLARRGQVALGDRLAVLAYGSNLNPGELERLSVERAIVVLRAMVIGAAAAYCTSQRADGQYPAGLVSVDPGHVEVHGVVLLDPESCAALDRKEGADHPWGAYARGTVAGITHRVGVVFEDGSQMVGRVPVYLQSHRETAARAGWPVLLADIDQHAFAEQNGVTPFPGTGAHGLDFQPSDGLLPLRTEPLPVFVYGTLRPGGTRYGHIEGGVSRHEPARLRARLVPTGADYPGLELSGPERGLVDGVLLHPHAAGLAGWLRWLDRIEAHPTLFRRVLCRVEDGRLAWVYVWVRG